jgi:hypothetical protein
MKEEHMHGTAQFDITVADLIGPRRSADLIPAHCAAAYVLRQCYPDPQQFMVWAQLREQVKALVVSSPVLAQRAIRGGR